uniref:AmmeMemoRadiSam system protein B n=1 Tax=Gracilinema caldarium TaxID=215591 RepID=A0A7C3I5Y1_9SPIR
MQNNAHDEALIRRSPVMAGIFYPDTPAGVRGSMHRFYELNGLQRSGTGPDCKPLVLIVPHAVWDLSGPLLARAFSLVKERQIDQVVLLGPLHASTKEGIYVSDSDCFETPLGDIWVHKAKVDELLSCATVFELNDIPHLSEHSLEVLLPWIFDTLPNVPIIPLLVGTVKTGHIHALSRALEVCFAGELDRTLFIATTNLSAHYDDAEAFEQGRRFLDLLQNGDGDQILSLTQQGKITACGASAVAALLNCRFWDSSSGPKPHILGQASSRGLWEEEDKSVHYAALCIGL